MESVESMLRELTEAHGVPGFEAPVRKIVRKYLEPLGIVSQDNLGSVICQKAGAFDSPRVMLVGHMDEVGFMVKHISEDGFLYFLPLGGWFDQVLLGQRVIIKTRKGDVVGVIGSKPPHLLSQKDRAQVFEKKDMYIDIGATSRDEVVATGVRPGDPVIPRADFVPLATGKTYLSKAFDDRVGTALVISALESIQEVEHPNQVFGVVTVQEEVGLRGARTSAWAVEPDVAIILESDIAGDVPEIDDEQSEISLGAGVSIFLYDRSMIPNLPFRDFVMDTADELGISYQLSSIEAGGTDGGAIHQHKLGVPTIVLGVPARHIHSHSSIIHRDDYDHAVKLLTALITRLDAETIQKFTA
jgi:endoglucanase